MHAKDINNHVRFVVRALGIINIHYITKLPPQLPQFHLPIKQTTILLIERIH